MGNTRDINPDDPEELEDLIDDAISDSFDMDWTSREGARAVLGALEHCGLQIVRAKVKEDGRG